MNVLEKFYGKDKEFSVLFDKYFIYMDTNENHYEEKYETSFNEYRRTIMSKIEEYISSKISSLTVSKELAKIDKTDFLVSSDFNRLYPSAMAHPDSNWPKIETAKGIDIKTSCRLCELFINGKWEKVELSGFFNLKKLQPQGDHLSTYIC